MHVAAELYLGKVFVNSLRAARSLAPDNDIHIMSACYGLLGLDECVASYDHTDLNPRLAVIIKAQGLARPAGEQVVLFLTKRYEAVALSLWPTAFSVFSGSRGGISQLARCYNIISKGAL